MLPRLIQSFFRDRSGNMTMLFAFTIIPVMLFFGMAIDYGKTSWLKSKVQNAADEAALGIVGQAANYIITHNDYPPQATVTQYINSAVQQIYAQTGVQLTNSQYPIYCAPTTATCSGTYRGASIALATGQALVNVPTNQPRLFWDAATTTAVPTTGSAMAGSGAAPMKVNFQFQYAKGQWYKVISLWATPNGTTVPVQIANWTYNSTNWSIEANPNPAPPSFVPYGSELGIGIVTTTYKYPSKVDANGAISLAGFQKPYVTMWSAGWVCPPGTTANTSANIPATAAQKAYYQQWYAGISAPATNITCTGTPSTNASDYTITRSDTGTNSDFIYLYNLNNNPITGGEQPANTPIPVASLFSCPASGSSVQTNTEQAWEDHENVANTNRDFFFKVTVSCSSTIANGVPKLQM